VKIAVASVVTTPVIKMKTTIKALSNFEDINKRIMENNKKFDLFE